MEYRCILRRTGSTVPTWRGHLTLVDGRYDRPVVSCGVDVVDVERLTLAVDRTGPALLRRVLTTEEQVAAASRAPSELWSVFGIKESAVKVVGGLPRGSSFHDVQVDESTGDNEARRIVLHGRLRDFPNRHTPVELFGDRLDITGFPPICWAVAISSGDNQ